MRNKAIIAFFLICFTVLFGCSKNNKTTPENTENNIEHEETDNSSRTNEIINIDNIKEAPETNKLIAGKGFELELGGWHEQYYFVDNNYMLIYFDSMSLWRAICVKAEYQYFEDGTIILSDIDYIYRSNEDYELWSVEDSELYKLGNIFSFDEKYPDDESQQWDKFKEVPVLSYDDIKERYRMYGIQIREKM